ncbi:unnamed protein product [Gadus morhua 'NCC']
MMRLNSTTPSSTVVAGVLEAARSPRLWGCGSVSGAAAHLAFIKPYANEADAALRLDAVGQLHGGGLQRPLKSRYRYPPPLQAEPVAPPAPPAPPARPALATAQSLYPDSCAQRDNA